MNIHTNSKPSKNANNNRTKTAVWVEYNKMARSKRTTRTAGSTDAAPSARVTSNNDSNNRGASNANNSNAAAVGRKKKKQQTLQDWTGGPTKSKSAEGGQKRWHNNNGE